MATDESSPPRPSTDVRQSRWRARALQLFGGTCVAIGGLSGIVSTNWLYTAFLPTMPLRDRFLRAAVVLLISAVLLRTGARVLRRARQHLTPVLRSLDELGSEQPPVLFLRSFSDDAGFARLQRSKWLNPWTTSRDTEEEQLARAVEPFGRMVALGRPGDPRPLTGAARHYASDEQWQDQVQKVLDQAGLVLLACGSGRGLQWEVDQLIARDRPEQLVLILSRDVDQYEEFANSLGVLFPRGLPEYRSSDLPSPAPAHTYTRAAVWFEADWTPHLEHLGHRDPSAREEPLVAREQWVRTAFAQAIQPVFERAGLSWLGLEAVHTRRPRAFVPGLVVFGLWWSGMSLWILVTTWTTIPTLAPGTAVLAIALGAATTHQAGRGGLLAPGLLRFVHVVSLVGLLLFGVVFSIGVGDAANAVLATVLSAGAIASAVLLVRRSGDWIAARMLHPRLGERGLVVGKRDLQLLASGIVLLVVVITGTALLYFTVPTAKEYTPDDGDHALREGCSTVAGRNYFPQNAPHTAHGPRTIAAFLSSDSDRFKPALSVYQQSGPHAEHRLRSPHQVQLIACLTPAEPGPRLNTCTDVHDTEVPLRQGFYDATVYEARTGREVGTERIVGDRSPDCPPLVTTAAEGHEEYTDPGEDELRHVLGKYVGG